MPHDPLTPLLLSGHAAVGYWTKQDLLQQTQEGPQAALWALPVPVRILHRQRSDGSWAYPGSTSRRRTDYDLLETYRQLGFLVSMFGLTRQHPAIARSADYVLSKQSPEGDIRGIYGNQFSPNYSAALLELLVRAGYGDDERVARGFSWLEDTQQDGGGWALAIRTRGRNLTALDEPETVQPDRSKPFSHFVTGTVLRAYAAHPGHRQSGTALSVSRLLTERIFEKDRYPDKNRATDWTEFCYPFWATDIVSALDAVSLINPHLRGEKINQAKAWLIMHQEPGGLFSGHLMRDRYHDLQLWFTLAVCRLFSRMPQP
ncbi:adenosine deaminase [Arthrobacter sp. SLBN-100]|uniref:adenosine deaminase n=1 Tax=Arthrobacter sp. SLBN-100 TaxID=2768450 RepID=UPI001F3A2679|nr:adenosine deaminase [Arthrobacter sp. SLBN-100]